MILLRAHLLSIGPNLGGFRVILENPGRRSNDGLLPAPTRKDLVAPGLRPGTAPALLSFRLASESCFHPSQVVVAVTHSVILQQELARERSISIERHRRGTV